MKNILKKLHIVSNEPPEEPDGSPPRGTSRSPSQSEHKPFANLSSWIGSVTSRHAVSPASPPMPSSWAGEMGRKELEAEAAAGKALGMDVEEEEELQIRLALELSAKEDPEAVQIEAVKQISLGSCPPENTPAEVLAYRYWNYNVLSYDDKVLDGFYDLYGIVAESSLVKMPSLINLQATPVSDNIPWEAVLVNKTNDADLLKLEQKALVMALELKQQSVGLLDLVRRLAVLVSDYMGGMVADPDSMSLSWRKLNNYLRASLGTMILPLGYITIGLARHRALLFKVLADSVGIPCQLLKGQQYTGSEDGALNIVKFSDGRECIVDLMADPGTLIPSDSAGLGKDFEETFFLVNPFLRIGNNSHINSDNYIVSSTVGCFPDREPAWKKSVTSSVTTLDRTGVDFGEPHNLENQESSQELCIENRDLHSDGVSLAPGRPIRSNQPYVLARSPSWTEGTSSPAVRRKKVKDVSHYMIEAAKENPQLAQKLHDVLLESGVVAPPDLFTDIYTECQDPLAADVNLSADGDEMKRKNNEPKNKAQDEACHCSFLPPLPRQNLLGKAVPSRPQPEPLRPIEGLGLQRSPASAEMGNVPCLSQSETSAAQLQEAPLQFMKNMPVAAAAATAAVVASSMVVAAAKSNSDIKMEVPVAAAATATAAAVVATTAAVSRQYEHSDNYASSQGVCGPCHNLAAMETEKDAIDGARVGSDHSHDDRLQQEPVANSHQEMDRLSDKSTGNESVRSDIALDDVAEWEIRWEDIILGERIGLGSFGEVYRGDLHGTEVAVKKFLHQDISSDTLEELISEVRIMKRLRHPNVVLFMGAVTHVPNLSIVTEFLPRGSLFRLIHRPNNQLDERRRLRMALDVARGMNYLHNCTPAIVHRDLKSPNLLVDKNWVVKVCDFGLSRIKHSTFLSSRSTAGTAEWMAPELLRNEPSDEKCDVFSFGVILWELCTLQQPWKGMNPMQVVGAVGFQHRRLDIPDNVDPGIADIITKCWQTDPKMRPSFAAIMGSLKPLQKSITASTQMTRRRIAAAESAGNDIL